MPLIVNGERIDDEVVGQEFSEIKSHHERVGQVSCCERDDEFRAQAKENIVGRVLVSQEAAKREAPVSGEEIDAALKRLIEEHGGEQQFYYNVGLTPEQSDIVRANIKTSLSVDKLLLEACGEAPQPDATELKAFYEENLENYMTQEEVRASHIFKSLQKAEEREELFKELCGIRQELLGGADFLEVAKRTTDKPVEEIDLGFYKRGELMEEFEIMTFSMKVGEISPVFTMHGSFHIATVTDRKSATAIPFDEVESDVREAYVQKWRDGRIQDYIKELRGKASIEDIEEEDEASEPVGESA